LHLFCTLAVIFRPDYEEATQIHRQFLWMLFIDSNNLVNHFKLSRKLDQLEDQKEFYLEKKVKINAEREELMSNPELLEKFARERYLMKKSTEDLYVIVEE
jgi:cell division protein FtsB